MNKPQQVRVVNNCIVRFIGGKCIQVRNNKYITKSGYIFNAKESKKLNNH